MKGQFKLRNTVALIAALFVLLSGCTAGAARSAQATAALDTRVAELVALTVSAWVTDTPLPSPTPSATLEPTATLTPQFLTISVSSETNCRSGPGIAYDVIGGLFPGQTADVLGRDAIGDYWVIRNPRGNPAFCWLWGKYATLSGDGESLPVATRPPMPTPHPDFTVSYVGTMNCGADYAFNFRIDNTGGRTLESLLITITDRTTPGTFTHGANVFLNYNGCSTGGIQKSLAPGEGSVTTSYNPGQLGYNPTGHSMAAAFTICTEDFQGGSCINRSISFTP